MKNKTYSITNSLGTEDWLESTKNITINAYIKPTIAENESKYTKSDFEHDLQKACSPK